MKRTCKRREAEVKCTKGAPKPLSYCLQHCKQHPTLAEIRVTSDYLAMAARQ